MKYGNVFTTSDYTNALLKSNRTKSGLKTWSQMYGSIDLAAQQAESALRSNYANEVSEAYANSYAQKSAIYGSKLSEGYKAAAASDMDAALNEAYESYRSSYNESLLDVESSKADAQSKVTELLTQQAENTKNYEQAHLDYLQYLWSGIESGELIDKGIPEDLWTQAGWSRLTTTDEQGNVTGLLPEDKIRSMMYDENGNLTLQGVDIYDMIENDLVDKGYSFGSYLAEQDEINNTDLLEWATSYNPYDYNDALTNAGSFKELMGMTSTDVKYSFIERFGGMTEDDINKVIGKFDKRIENISASINNIEDADADKVKTEIYGLIDDVEELAKQYGFEDISLDEYKNIIDENFFTVDEVIQKQLLDYDIQTGLLRAGAVIAGAGAGAAAGSGIPIIGNIIGGLIGGTIGYTASLAIENEREQGRDDLNNLAKERSNDAKVAVLDMLTYLSMTMKKTQRDRQASINQPFSK